MNEEQAINIVIRHLEKDFPRTCPCCGRRFKSLSDYIRNTTHRGEPISYDAERGDYTPKKPVGTYALSNCQCGTTMSIGSEGIAPKTLARFMLWAKKESMHQRLNFRRFLQAFRLRVEEAVQQRDASAN